MIKVNLSIEELKELIPGEWVLEDQIHILRQFGCQIHYLDNLIFCYDVNPNLHYGYCSLKEAIVFYKTRMNAKVRNFI